LVYTERKITSFFVDTISSIKRANKKIGEKCGRYLIHTPISTGLLLYRLLKTMGKDMAELVDATNA